MYIERALKSFSTILIFIGLFACGSLVKAPKDAVPKLNKLSETANGGWITFDNGEKKISGELIGFKEDSLFVLSERKILSFSQNNIQSARLIFFNTRAEEYGVWTGVNSLFTIANGAFLIFTLPINLIVGTSVSSSESKRINYIDFPEYAWADFQKFARFPQGLLDSIDRKELEF